VFVYFYKGLSENMEGRLTRCVYNEIITCAAIFINLEDSRRTWAEVEPGRGPAQGARPRVEGARPTPMANQRPLCGSCSTTSNLQEKLYD